VPVLREKVAAQEDDVTITSMPRALGGKTTWRTSYLLRAVQQKKARGSRPTWDAAAVGAASSEEAGR